MRIKKYRLLSDSKRVKGKAKYVQPVLISGIGSVIFGSKVYFGTVESPFYYSGYSFINTRHLDAEIWIGDNVWINNNLTIIAQEAGIYIGSDTLIGMNVEIYDCDFHHIHPSRRKHHDDLPSQKVRIGSNVWLGSNVKILKGVTIGDNSIIANGSIVTGTIPKNTIWGGVPAKFLKNIDL